MSRAQYKIISHLLGLAEKSTGGKNWQMHASGICCGSKLICSSINNSRSKFGKNIYPCGHSEANCIWKYECAFRGKGNPSLVLTSSGVKLKS